MRGFVAGVLAGLPMALVMFVLASAIGLPTLPDLIADPLLFLVPGAVFGVLIDALQFGAKTLLFASLLVGQLGVCGLVGRYWAVRNGASAPREQWRSALSLVAIVYVAVSTVGLIAVGVGPFGLGLPTGPLYGSLGLLAVHLAYAVGLVVAFRALGAAAGVAPDLGRRRALAVVGGAALAVVGGGTLWRALGGVPVAGATVGGGTGEISPNVTPTDVFYTVSKNFSDPQLNPTTWKVEIAGVVERPATYTYEQLRALPSQEQHFTLACISNLVGGDLIGNGHWRGVFLKDLIAAAGPRGVIRKVVFYAADGYADSILFSKAVEAQTMLAYEMNGAPLTYKHGAPARLLIPGIFGMKNVKWVTRIDLLDREFRGYWQDRGWSDPAPVQTFSRIDAPGGGRGVSAPVLVGGIAHSGDRGIKRVELSLDGGRSWHETELTPPLSPNAWTLWRYEWSPPNPGAYTLKVRATDGLGRVQVPDNRDSFPDGATGWHTRSVRVV